ncbi:CBS domain-containing protein [Gemmatimonadota bacterium]
MWGLNEYFWPGALQSLTPSGAPLTHSPAFKPSLSQPSNEKLTIEGILREKGHRVITAGPQAPVLEVIRLLTAHDIGAVVVADEENPVGGILTERDILRLSAQDPLRLDSLSAGKAMSRPVLVAAPEDPVPLVMETMVSKRIRHLPVVDRESLTGIVSMRDLVDAFRKIVEVETHSLKDYLKKFMGGSSPTLRRFFFGRRSEPDPSGGSGPAYAGIRLREILSEKGKSVVTVSPGTPLLEVIQTLVEHEIGSAVVMEGGTVEGIVTERDTLRATAEDPSDLRSLEACDVMTGNLVVGDLDDGVAEAMDVMARNSVRHLPVFRRDALEGIVSIRDVTEGLLKQVQAENHRLRDRIHGKLPSSP